jgi:hypothetical protein
MADTLANPDELNKPADDESWTERESEASVENPPTYPHNKVMMTESGHLFEMDDTLDRERIRLQHGGAKNNGVGTFFEMHSNGDMTTKIQRDNYQIVMGKNRVLIKGVCNVTIEGDSIVHVKGNKYERIDGDLVQEVRGNVTQNFKKKAKILSDGDMSIGCGDPATGKLSISNGDHTYIQGDLVVAGSIEADMVTAKTKVNAGKQVNAGPLGFVSETGGLAVGFPVAIPYCITAPEGFISAGTTVFAGVSVEAPIINGFSVNDTAGTMMGIRMQHNAHNHIGNKGFPTSPPITPMTLL